MLKAWLLWLLLFVRRILVIGGFFGLMTAQIPYDWAALFVRLAVGMALFPFGLKKLFDRQDADKFPKVLFFSPRAGFYSVMVIELLVPVCLVLGLFTRLAVVPAICSFAVATKVTSGPYLASPASLYLLMMIVILLVGAGDISLDCFLRLRLS